ncbi:MAG: zinc-binding alcohol dehydrogenase [Phreatobacter sp.]|uniref:zinc-dependent alcohol dehydrogenase n=1 Tax=Phreatobacter sp. TaxID=1966341 RepID=UPI002732E205|nr:zinc-binding alcohol dehydrogenase [Phreatobacter sp.]MDP2800985.1 zinc-binding alcohol dehydrogenase [Phreatobacter sp.]
MAATARALWYVSRRKVDLRDTTLDERGPADAEIRMLYSGVSRGTERLVFNGLVAAPERERMRCPLQEGEFPFPVKYGYCAVGEVEAGPEHLVGRTVFTLAPHQTRFLAPTDRLSVVPVPANVPARRAILAANMETALNAVWDSGVGPGDRIVVVGGGVLGLLVTFIVAQIPGAEVTLVDLEPSRRDFAKLFGVKFQKPLDGPADCDVAFHASATGAGLACALACCGDEATVVELSWFGDQDPAVPLGAGFHSKRLKLISSQVGMVATSRRPRWSYPRRLEKALGLLADDRLDQLITGDVAFEDLPAALPRILEPGAHGLMTAVTY